MKKIVSSELPFFRRFSKFHKIAFKTTIVTAADRRIVAATPKLLERQQLP